MKRRCAIMIKPELVTRLEERYIDIDTNYGPNYSRSIGYHESRQRSLSTPENFPAGTQKVKIVFDVNREAFWDFYVAMMTKSAPWPCDFVGTTDRPDNCGASRGAATELSFGWSDYRYGQDSQSRHAHGAPRQ